jgi:SAM-dependent methyltransferase
VAFLNSHPGWKATLFDLKDTLPLSKRYLEKANLLHRTTLHEGDFYRDPLPQGIDLALLSAIIHQNSPAQNLDLYGKVRKALRPGGRLVIRDHVMSEEKTWPLSGALFAVNMLVCTPGGNSYSFSEIAEVLKQAGFSGIRQMATGAQMDSLIEATSP